MPVPILFYTRRRTHTVTDQPHRADFRCTACGYASEVVVFGSSTGRDVGGAGADTREAAMKSAADNARVTLHIAPCPQCGERDPERVRSFRTKTLALGAVLAAILVAALVVLNPPSWFLVAGGGLGVFVLYLVIDSRLQQWRSAARDVEFLEEVARPTGYRKPPVRVGRRYKLTRAKLETFPRIEA